MEQELKTIFIFLFVVAITCGCRSFVPFNCETYTPEKESLSFINESICVYTQYDIINNKVYSDSCNWIFDTRNSIVLRRNFSSKDSSYMSNDSIRKNRLCFIYDICPKWYNITSDEFMSYPDYKYPLYQEETSIPYRTPSFYEKFGVKISCDTAKFVGTRCLAVLKKPNAPHFFFTNIAVKGRSVKADSRFAKKELEGFYSWLTNSYEYINYKVNHEREVDFNIDSIRGKQFSFIEDSCKKESLQFINDSVCLHSLSFKTDIFSTYESSILDTCHYAFKNNLIGVNLIKGNSCDTLTYSNGILFYSKVYKDDNNEGYKHIVKPFIDETRSCANKIDSINMIMSTYFNVYVPLNFYK